MNKESSETFQYSSQNSFTTPSYPSPSLLASGSSESGITDFSNFSSEVDKIAENASRDIENDDVRNEVRFIGARAQAAIDGYKSLINANEQEILSLSKRCTTSSKNATSFLANVSKSLKKLIKFGIAVNSEKDASFLWEVLHNFQMYNTEEKPIEELFLTVQNLVDFIVSLNIKLKKKCFDENSSESQSYRSTEDEMNNSLNKLSETVLGYNTTDMDKIIDKVNEYKAYNKSLVDMNEKLIEKVKKQKETIKDLNKEKNDSKYETILSLKNSKISELESDLSAKEDMISSLMQNSVNDSKSASQALEKCYEKLKKYKQQIIELKAQKSNLKSITVKITNDINVLAQRYETVVKQLATASSELQNSLNSQVSDTSVNSELCNIKRELQSERIQNSRLEEKMLNMNNSLIAIENILSQKPGLSDVKERIQSIIEENNATQSSSISSAPSSLKPLSSTFFTSSSSNSKSSYSKEDEVLNLHEEIKIQRNINDSLRNTIAFYRNKLKGYIQRENSVGDEEKENLIKEEECLNLKEKMKTNQMRQATLEKMLKQYSQERSEVYQMVTEISLYLQSSKISMESLIQLMKKLFSLFSIPFSYNNGYNSKCKNYVMTTKSIASAAPCINRQTIKSVSKSLYPQSLVLEQIRSKMNDFPIKSILSSSTTAPLTCFSSFINLYDDINMLVNQIEINTDHISMITRSFQND